MRYEFDYFYCTKVRTSSIYILTIQVQVKGVWNRSALGPSKVLAEPGSDHCPAIENFWAHWTIARWIRVTKISKMTSIPVDFQKLFIICCAPYPNTILYYNIFSKWKQRAIRHRRFQSKQEYAATVAWQRGKGGKQETRIYW
jgi:hypothetical protein